MLAVLFIPLAAAIIYMDIRYRRIPNKLVFAVLVAGLIAAVAVAVYASGGTWATNLLNRLLNATTTS